jgi:hypothetical protein
MTHRRKALHAKTSALCREDRWKSCCSWVTTQGSPQVREGEGFHLCMLSVVPASVNIQASLQQRQMTNASR